MPINKPRYENKELFSDLTHSEIINFVLARFEEFKLNPSMENLIHFHTINKFLIMVHSPKGLNILGNLVANHTHEDITELVENYGRQLELALKNPPSKKTHANVLSHVFGHFSSDLNSDAKSSFLTSLEQFRDGKITLSDILCLIKSWVTTFDKTYLTRQTYFLLYYQSPTQSIFFKN